MSCHPQHGMRGRRTVRRPHLFQSSVVVLLTFMLLSGCGGDDNAPTATATHPSGPPPTSVPGFAASPSPSPGREAPDVDSPPLQFRQVRVYPEPASGVFTVRANVTNGSSEFLNGVRFTWAILDAAGTTLDEGDGEWPSLAPGETTTLTLTGNSPHTEGWTRVEFNTRE